MIKIATRYPIPETIKKITLNVRYEEYIRNVQNIYIYFFLSCKYHFSTHV